MELPFMFHNLDGEPALLDPTDNPTGYQRLAETMQDSWISFTRTGDPSTDALGVWPTYDEDDRHTMVFDLNSQLVADPYPAERIAWGDIPFDGLTPSLVRTNPLSHPDTEITLPVIIAVIGPIWTALIVVAFLALLAGIGAGIFWLVRRRRRNTTAQ
jgi:hypothetical protein